MISIIIPTLNRVDALTLALRSFVAQGLPVERFEILIVDNGSTDATRRASEQFMAQHPSHQIRYLFEPEPGLLSGRHRGALEARGSILTFVDDDIEADPRWLEAIQEAFADPSVQLVGGRNWPRYEAEAPRWIEWFWHDEPYGRSCGWLSLSDLGDRVRDIDPDDIWGLNFSIRKEALFELGGFHPDIMPRSLQYFQGDGETGLTQEAKNRGYRAIYQPHALVYHHVPAERMTYEYFDKRFFYQGVCDSYTHIRQRHRELMGARAERLQEVMERIKGPLRPLKRRLLGKAERPDEKMALERRFHRAYARGYEFHRSTVRRNPALLTWILR